MGFFFVFTTLAILTGWGTSHVDTFAGSVENPVILLAKRLWGRAWIFVMVAVINSILGAAIAGTNAAVRVFYAMGERVPCPLRSSMSIPDFAPRSMPLRCKRSSP